MHGVCTEEGYFLRTWILPRDQPCSSRKLKPSSLKEGGRHGARGPARLHRRWGVAGSTEGAAGLPWFLGERVSPCVHLRPVTQICTRTKQAYDRRRFSSLPPRKGHTQAEAGQWFFSPEVRQFSGSFYISPLSLVILGECSNPVT